MNYQTSFTLNKAHYNECFEQSQSITPKSNRRYFKTGALALLGFFFYLTKRDGLSAHLGAFFFILAFVDALSVLYAQAWWVNRQMFSKAAGNKVQIKISETGLEIKSDFVNKVINFADISSVKSTEKGIILMLSTGGNSYLSKNHFSAEAWQFLLAKLVE